MKSKDIAGTARVKEKAVRARRRASREPARGGDALNYAETPFAGAV